MIIISGIFLYVQFLFIQIEDSQVVPVRYSREYDCRTVVESRAEAATCFNGFFKDRLNEIQTEGEDLSDEVMGTYGEVSEADIFIVGGLYRIDRNGNGSYYFIKDKYVMLQKE